MSLKFPQFALVIICVGFFGPIASPFERFIRGDADANGKIEITDAVRVLEYLFLGIPPGLPCLEAADVDNDGLINITDPIRILDFQFIGTFPEIPPPFPGCGVDTIFPDRLPYYSLGCEGFEFCNTLPYSFYGKEYLPDAVFFVSDRSQRTNGELRIFQRETARNILGFRDGVQFGIYLFDSTEMIRFPADDIPVGADDRSIRVALEWLLPIEWSSSLLACPREALLAAINTMENSLARNRTIFLLARSAARCREAMEQEYLDETIAIVTDANRDQGSATIHTIATGGPDAISTIWTDFLQRLAELNGGTYTFILR